MAGQGERSPRGARTQRRLRVRRRRRSDPIDTSAKSSKATALSTAAYNTPQLACEVGHELREGCIFSTPSSVQNARESFTNAKVLPRKLTLHSHGHGALHPRPRKWHDFALWRPSRDAPTQTGLAAWPRHPVRPLGPSNPKKSDARSWRRYC